MKGKPSLHHPPKLQSRSYTYWQRFRDSFQVAARDVHRKHPIGFPLVLLFAVANTATLIYFVYDYVTRVHPKFERFSKHVSGPLRKAIYYSELDMNPKSALHYYKQALLAASKTGLHPFSDEVLGIRFAISSMLEKAGLIKASIEVLEKTLSDCQEWIKAGRRRKLLLDREREEGVENTTRVVRPSDPTRVDDQIKKEADEDELRDRVMKKLPGVSIKLAELYETEHAHDMQKVEQSLITAVELARAELQRRRDRNLPISAKAGDSFLNLTEGASTYNELADFYTRTGKNDLASGLYMQSLSLLKEDEDGSPANKCAQVMLLNNISSQMAEYAQLSLEDHSFVSGSNSNPISREQLLSAAAEWANKALDVTSGIEVETRNGECARACQAALYNLGEIAEMQGSKQQAKSLYARAKASALEIRFAEGAELAEEALKRLETQE
ncbi:hypothetical protein FQN57_002238 [Myotisia sp. PD_48]|nr:hypothetical protein FQN57_002238 [Myotisia sp. PD_48]